MNGFDLSTISAAYLGSTAISEIYYGSTKIWPSDPLSVPLTFDILTSGTVYWRARQSGDEKNIQYSKNGGAWTSITSSTSGVRISVQAGDILRFKGNNASYGRGNVNYYSSFDSSCNLNVRGNIMSLFNNSTDFSSDYAAPHLFDGTKIIDASKLLLPSTVVSSCYYMMFSSCTSLTTAPELPATTLADSCYGRMFYGCTSLTSAPELPATTLTKGCYYQMFYGCTSLNYVKCLASSGMTSSNCLASWLNGVASSGTFVKSPNATTGSTAGASQWKLNDASGIPANWTVVDYGLNISQSSLSINGNGGTTQIVVTSTDQWSATTENDWITISPSSSSIYETTVDITVASNNSSEIRSGSVVFTDGTHTATLSVSQEAASQYQPLTFDILGSGTIGWKASNSSLTKTIQYKKNNGSWTSITSTTSGVTISVANGDVVQFKGDNTAYGNSSYYNTFTATCNFTIRGNIMSLINSSTFSTLANFTATYALRGLFYGNTYLQSAENLILPSGTYQRCYQAMFRGCTGLTTAPVLPATAPVTYAYYNMFYGCSSLTYIKCLATDISASNCTSNWVNGVTSTSGTFVKAASMSSWTTGNAGIPSGWAVEDES